MTKALNFDCFKNLCVDIDRNDDKMIFLIYKSFNELREYIGVKFKTSQGHVLLERFFPSFSRQ